MLCISGRLGGVHRTGTNVSCGSYYEQSVVANVLALTSLIDMFLEDASRYRRSPDAYLDTP